MQGVPHSSGDDDGADSRDLVVDRVQPGHSLALAEVTGVRASVEGANGDNESEPIDGRDEPTTPYLRGSY